MHHARMPTARVLLALAILGAGAGTGCTCRKSTPEVAPSSGSASPPDRVAAPAAQITAPRFSAPIAATAVGDGAVVVAGLAAADKRVRVARIEGDGRVGWSRDVFEGAAWASDAELSLYRVDKGLVVLWRGLQGGKQRRSAVLLSEDGLASGPPFVVGSVACATQRGLYWIEAGKRSVQLATPGGSPPVTLALPGKAERAESELGLACDERHAVVVEDSDGDLATLALPPRERASFVPLLGEKDFGDEEREHSVFFGTEGLGLLRVSHGGALALRAPDKGGPAPWKKLSARLGDEDDLVAVDADARAVYAVSTRVHEGCAPGEDAGALPTLRTSRFSTEVRLLRFELASDAITQEELGRGSCGHPLGTFFLGEAAGAEVLAWSERGPTGGKLRAPIVALSYRVLGGGPGPRPTGRIELSGDALVDAGCDASHCYAAVLERPAAKDDREPESIRVVRYP